MDHMQTLAQLLNQALEQKSTTAEAVAERTKVPRSTVRALCGATDPAILPQRVYLRGHVVVVARELGIDIAEVLARFDRENPSESKIEEAPVEPRFSRFTMAAAAALGGIGFIAVILAFAN